MSRTPIFHQLARTLRKAEFGGAQISRREVLKGAAAAAGSLALGPILGARNMPAPRIAIVGAGLAGLVCADRLRAKGQAARIYEAGSRVGGRCQSLRSYFPGQTAELGGEFIDTGHKRMLAYANEFNLAKEDVNRVPGETAFYVLGQRITEEEVVDEYRQLVPRMRQDIQTLSGAPTFFDHSNGDVALDHMDLETYLETRATDLPLIRKVVEIAYVAEYGLEAHEQSCLNFLLFIHSDRRSKFTPFGVFSDERYHLVNGNDAIAQNIAARLPNPVEFGMKLTHLGRNAAGDYVLNFAGGETCLADSVVLSIPFTVLREVALEPSLGLSADKLRAISDLGYGNNAKTMLGFSGKPWLEFHSGNGETFTDLPNAQNAWETSPRTAVNSSILTDYASGDRGLNLADGNLNSRVNEFLASMEIVYPGLTARYSGLAKRKHWPSDTFTKGSYTCYRPGQFTNLAGLEGQPAGLLKFAGEHADSFYSWQGFMEGACLSGLRAANEILADIRSGAL